MTDKVNELLKPVKANINMAKSFKKSENFTFRGSNYIASINSKLSNVDLKINWINYNIGKSSNNSSVRVEEIKEEPHKFSAEEK